MTLEQLQAKIDKYIGMKSSVEVIQVRPNQPSWRANLVYRSKTGVKLFELIVSDFSPRTDSNNTDWQFGGTTTALPDDWKNLCKLHKT